MPSNHRHLGGQVAAWPPGVSLAAGTTETPGVLRRFHPLPRSCGRVHVLGREWPPLLSPSRAPLRGTGGHFSPYGCQPISGASSSRGALLSTEREKRGHGCSTAHTYAQSLFDLVSALPGAEADGDQVEWDRLWTEANTAHNEFLQAEYEADAAPVACALGT
jgi:hypothetical protein